MIGYEPYVETMTVIDGQDFSHFFEVEDDEAFPPGPTLTFKILARDNKQQLGAWPAVTVEPGGALVQITAEDLINIPDASQFRVYVDYPDGQTLCWYRGRVWRRI